MAGIDHVMINANDFERAVKFYSWLMPKLGYPQKHEFGGPDPVIGFSGDSGSVWLMKSAADFRADRFDKRRVGLREIAFGADDRALVNAIAKEIEQHGGKVLDPPKAYPQYTPDYYSVFFTDPDGLKLEVVTHKK
jgi:catechol 2,3-dioxygenase-like lactoylglutathione lyase family enzyme